jgi:type I restriction enzyme R subunit
VKPKILTIQKIGYLGVHSDKPISSSDSLHTLKELFHVLYWLARSYKVMKIAARLEGKGTIPMGA